MKAQLIIVPFLLAFALSLAVTYLTILVYRGLGIVDKSTKKDHPKHVHDKPVPRGGGIPIMFAMVFVTIASMKLDTHLVAILSGGLVILILGVFAAFGGGGS